MRSLTIFTTMASTMKRMRATVRPLASGRSASTHSIGPCVMVSVGTVL